MPTVTFPDNLVIHALGSDFDLCTKDMTGQTVAQMVRQAAAIIGQRVDPSSKLGPSERHSKIREKLDEIASNTYSFGSGGGGARLDEITKECRLLAEAFLVKGGAKVTEAKERARTYEKWATDEQVARWEAKAEKLIALRESDDDEIELA